VILALPGGIVEAEALWTVHDRWRYLWMLSDGRFLLRDGKNLEQGDATLEVKPFLRFPGPLIWLEMDPAQQFMVTESASRRRTTPAKQPAPRPRRPARKRRDRRRPTTRMGWSASCAGIPDR